MSERSDSDDEPLLDRDPVVLVVDDEEDLADLYSQWLSDDYAVRTTYNGEQALERLDETVDVVLLNRRMPGLSGDNALNRIREREYDCQVAMVTAVDPEYDIIELGFDDYVTKPVSKEDLHGVVEELLTRVTYNETLQQYYAAVSTRVALDAEKQASDLADDERYAEITAEIEALGSDLDLSIHCPDGALIHYPRQSRGMAELPDEDASAAEKARWMGEDFGVSLADGIEAAVMDDNSDG